LSFWQKLKASILGFEQYPALFNSEDKTNGIGFVAVLLLFVSALSVVGMDMFQQNMISWMIKSATTPNTYGGASSGISRQQLDTLMQLRNSGGFLSATMYIQTYVVGVIRKCIGAATLAWIGTSYARRHQQSIEFHRAWRIGLYAATLPTLVESIWMIIVPTVVKSLPSIFLGFAALPAYWAIAVYYTIKGFQAILKEQASAL
jgi:hypothetical protein